MADCVASRHRRIPGRECSRYRPPRTPFGAHIDLETPAQILASVFRVLTAAVVMDGPTAFAAPKDGAFPTHDRSRLKKSLSAPVELTRRCGPPVVVRSV